MSDEVQFIPGEVTASQHPALDRGFDHDTAWLAHLKDIRSSLTGTRLAEVDAEIEQTERRLASFHPNVIVNGNLGFL